MIFLVPLLFASACSEVVDLDVEPKAGQLVIYGRFTNSTTGNTLRISRAALPGGMSPGLRGAIVTVTDDQGNSATYHDLGEGNYELAAGALEGEPGHSYQLNVRLPNGANYSSNVETMPPVSARDTVYYDIEVIEETSNQGVTSVKEVVSVWADTEIYDQRPDLFIKWNLEEVYTQEQSILPLHSFPFYKRLTCYITNEEEQQTIMLYNGAELRAEQINGQFVTSRVVDGDFRTTYFFNLIQQNLTPGAFQYWQALDRNINRVGSIFDQPPGLLPTNLYNVDDPTEEVIGYFEVASVDTARAKVTNREINRFYEDPCELPPEANRVPLWCYDCILWFVDDYCIDCTLLKNSSLVRPHYFGD